MSQAKGFNVGHLKQKGRVCGFPCRPVLGGELTRNSWFIEAAGVSLLESPCCFVYATGVLGLQVDKPSRRGMTLQTGTVFVKGKDTTQLTKESYKTR